MNNPAISVILPAYNCAAFIGDAIRSVLNQSFSDIELIIINDGSTDNTEMEILAFTDQRIVYQKNKANEGLIFTLNKAIGLAQGKYIARMDADDICKAGRFELQKNWLDQHSDISMVASTVELINKQGELTGVWELDRVTITPAEIKNKMIIENCIAHPSVMIRSNVLKQFLYHEKQKNIEDYDLWLRLLNRRHKISKLQEPLLLYRVHDASVTGTVLKKTNPFFKQMLMKCRMITNEIKSGHFSWFGILVIFSIIPDLFKGIIKEITGVLKK